MIKEAQVGDQTGESGGHHREQRLRPSAEHLGADDPVPLLGRPALLLDVLQPLHRVLDGGGQRHQHGRDPVAQRAVFVRTAHRYGHHPHQRAPRLLAPLGEERPHRSRGDGQDHIVGRAAEHFTDPADVGQWKGGEGHPPVR